MRPFHPDEGLTAIKRRPATGRDARALDMVLPLDAPSPSAAIWAMAVFQREIEITTRGAGFSDVSARVQEVVSASAIATGLCTVFVRHTSASLVIQENADGAVLRDLGRWMGELAPEARDWEHDTEGPDDMPAHARAAVTRTSEAIPVTAGRLALGTWQGLYLWEHRSRPQRRRLVVHVAGEPDAPPAG
jgi:secondary thiamine-phosphate synthase enzyme